MSVLIKVHATFQKIKFIVLKISFYRLLPYFCSLFSRHLIVHWIRCPYGLIGKGSVSRYLQLGQRELVLLFLFR